MMWQDRFGTWHSTVSPIDAKIMSMDTNRNRDRVESDYTGDDLFDEIFAEFYSDSVK